MDGIVHWDLFRLTIFLTWILQLNNDVQGQALVSVPKGRTHRFAPAMQV